MTSKKEKTASKEVLLWKYKDHPEFSRLKKIKKADEMREELKKLDMDVIYHEEDVEKYKAFLEEKNKGVEVKKARKVKAPEVAVSVAEVVVETAAIQKPNLKALLIDRLHKVDKEYNTNNKTIPKLKDRLGEELVKEVEEEFKRVEDEFKVQNKNKKVKKIKEVAVASMVSMADLPEGWPPAPEEYEDKGNKKKTEGDINALLEKHNITEGLPRGKEPKKKLFKKKRCTGDNNPCSEEEHCDLRKNLCVDKTDVANNANKMDKEVINGKSYYGTKEARALVKDALLAPASPSPVAPVAPAAAADVVEVATVTKVGGGVTESKTPPEVVVEQEQEIVEKPGAISPISINRLLDKSSEEDIRKTILNCLGLYHELVNPNDEIVLRTS
jgi:hypothetical protein